MRMRRANGEVVEVFYVRALADALQRSAFTVRRWEKDGTLPPTPLVHRIRNGPARRLFLREQIEAIVRIAREEGVAPGKPADISATRFTARVEAYYNELFTP
jgi:hypothetical protein